MSFLLRMFIIVYINFCTDIPAIIANNFLLDLLLKVYTYTYTDLPTIVAGNLMIESITSYITFVITGEVFYYYVTLFNVWFLGIIFIFFFQ